ncbi:MAG: CoA transferase [Dehalococcoidales bacterium]|nr:CoA transferase [Dehalococcoidales bacterium]
MDSPLKGYRILDLSRAIAGPYGAMTLGDMGAEIIKVEAPGGELSRNFAGPKVHDDSFYYLAFNRNKKSVILDLGTESGKQALLELVKVSDVVWENFRNGVMDRLGLGYEKLKEVNPKIIMCSISGFGSSGPYIDYPAFDIAVQGIAGTMSLTGEPGRKPVKPGFPAADILGGLFGALSVCAALTQRERTGEGRHIDIGLLDCMLSAMAYEFSYYFTSGIVPQPMGSGHLALVPYGAYKCKEGYVIIGVAWPRLAKVIGAEWMIDDPRFKDTDSRMKNREVFNQTIEKYLAAAPAADWLELFHVEDIMSGPVNTLDKAAEDPQINHRNMILKLPHPQGGEIRLIGNAAKMDGIDESKYTAPPFEGQHTDEVLKGILKYTDTQINALKKEEDEHTDALLARLKKTSDDYAVRLLKRKAEREAKQ